MATAPLPFLEGALLNRALAPRHLVLLLRNRSIPADLIRRICQSPAWLKPYEVKVAIVLHSRTPWRVALSLIPHLRWADLARVADRASFPPRLRRSAEVILAIRVQEMALGERIALARTAGRGLIGALREDDSPLVIRALLQNPHFREEDALAIASRRTPPPAVLLAITEDDHFALRPAVQRAIAQNPETPASAALRAVHRLSSRELLDLLHSPDLPGLVSVAARRLLEARRRPPPGGELRGESA